MFTDNSVSNHNNLIRINRSAQDKVVTINLDHIGVRVYISQFPSTPFLNVVIKFRTATTRLVNHSLVLEAISPYSLCKSGCHPRELVNIREMLENAGIDTKEKEYQFDKAPKERTPEKNENKDHDKVEHYDHELERNDHSTTVEDKDGNDEESDADGFFDEEDSDNAPPLVIERFRRDSIGRRLSKFKKESKRQRPIKSTMLRSSEPVVVESAALTSIEKTNFLNNRQLPIALSNHLCDELKGYYRLTCLYDVHLKKITTDQPHSFASSFDEVRAELIGVRIGSGFDSNQQSSSSISNLYTCGLFYLLASSLIILACWYQF